MSHPNHLTGADSLQSVVKLSGDLEVYRGSVRRDPHDHDADCEAHDVVLVFEIAIQRDEHVELILCDSEQFAIFDPAPAHEFGAVDVVLIENRPNARVHTLIEKVRTAS